eukprot:3559587-Alexandrium_andersonii.AAC.1
MPVHDPVVGESPSGHPGLRHEPRDLGLEGCVVSVAPGTALRGAHVGLCHAFRLLCRVSIGPYGQ